MGYVEYIEVRKIGENKIEYIMKNPIIASSAKKLIESERIPPHISTSLMFALLKQFNMKAEMIDNPIFMSDGRIIEKWRLIQK